MWKILQTNQFSEWFTSSDIVDEDASVSIYPVMKVLKSLGPNLGRPYVDSVKGSRYENMKELRVQSKGRGGGSGGKEMKAEKYTDFFEEAEKSMSRDSIRRAEGEANKIILNLGLAELRKNAGHSQSAIPGYRQSSVSKIEARKDMKISTLVSYCRSLGLGVEINAVQVNQKGKSVKKNLLRIAS